MRHGVSPSSKSAVLFGETPYGWRLGPGRAHLVVDRTEQTVIAAIRRLHTHRGMSIREIVAELAYMGVVNRRGRNFSTTRVFNILHAPTKPPQDARRRGR
jgi:hypothetical protein